MPIYEYACEDCGTRTSILFMTFAETHDVRPSCSRCGSSDLTRLISLAAFVERRDLLTSLADGRFTGGLGGDSKALGRWARTAGEAVGKDLGPNWEDSVRFLESGDTQGTVEVAPPGGFGEPGPDGLPNDVRGD